MNLAAEVMKLFRKGYDERVFRAIVTGTSGNKVLIKRAGQAAADTQAYARLVSYATPAADDEVLVIEVGGGPLVVGKITR